MEIQIDGARQALDASDCANLAEVVAKAERASMSDENSIVVSVDVNDEALPSEQLGNLETVSLEGIERVSIERRPARWVAHSVLSQGSGYTQQILIALDRTVEHYRGSRSDLGGDLLMNVSDSLMVLAGITFSVAQALGDLPEAGDEVQALGRLQNELAPWLEEMIEAQQGEDAIRISDTLEYEIRPIIESWGEAMKSLMAVLAVGSEPPHSS